MSRTKNIICITLSIILGALLISTLYLNIKQRQELQKAAEDIIAEARPYRQELQDIEEELNNLSADTSYVIDTARFIVAFELSDVSDLSYIREQSETYGISPVLALDCTDEPETLEAYMDAAADTGWEIILFADYFSEDTIKAVQDVQQALEDRELEDTGIFLLRYDYAAAEIIQALVDAGFTGYTIYNDTPAYGFTDEGIIYFDYSYIQSASETISSRLSLAYSGKCPILTLFDLEKVWNGTMSEDYVSSILALLETYTGYDDACFSTVADVADELREAWKTVQERQKEYDDYVAEQQERIDELNRIIDEIYDQLSDVY